MQKSITQEKVEEDFTSNYEGKFLLFGRPEEATMDTYWMHVDKLDNNMLVGRRDAGRNVVKREFDSVQRAVSAGSYTIYDTYEALSEALRTGDGEAHREEERNSQEEKESQEFIAQNTISTNENTLAQERTQILAQEEVQQTAPAHPVFAEDLEDVMQEDEKAHEYAVATNNTPSLQLIAQKEAREAMERKHDVAEAPEKEELESVRSSNEETVNTHAKNTPEIDNSNTQVNKITNTTEKNQESKEKNNANEEPVKDIFEQYSEREDLQEINDPPKSHALTQEATTQNEEQPATNNAQQATHSAKAPADNPSLHKQQSTGTRKKFRSHISFNTTVQTKENHTPIPRAAQPQKVYSGLSAIESAEVLWKAYEPDIKGDDLAKKLFSDLQTFSTNYFGQFPQEQERMIYAWQSLVQHVPAHVKKTIAYTEFDKQYGKDALIRYLNAKPR